MEEAATRAPPRHMQSNQTGDRHSNTQLKQTGGRARTQQQQLTAAAYARPLVDPHQQLQPHQTLHCVHAQHLRAQGYISAPANTRQPLQGQGGRRRAGAFCCNSGYEVGHEGRQLLLLRG